MPKPGASLTMCPKCSEFTTAIYATKHPAPDRIVRYRKCSSCGHRFHGVEIIMKDQADV